MFSALAWSRGEFSDSDLLRESQDSGGPSAPALLIASLVGLAGVRGLLRELRWYRHAHLWVFRTKTPQVIAWAHEYGAVKTYVERDGKARYVARDGACVLFLSRGINSTRGESAATRSRNPAGSGTTEPPPENLEKMG